MTLPPDFIERTRSLLGNEFTRLETALTAEAPISIRVNPLKGITKVSGDPVDWCRDGYYLPQRLSFTFDPLFHAGAYYVQEASSMFLEQAIHHYIAQPVKCLDLCAAPGGKSTHLASILPENSLLVSNEVIRSRSHILAENITKWGTPYTIVTNNDPEEMGRLTHLFDLIVTDVPCSGEGMFRKDPASITEWSAANVKLCASRQRRIIHDIWEALKPGGLLIYSTCTYNTEENEENIDYIINELGAEALPIPIQEKWGITGPLKYNHPVYRFFPHKSRGEGFFLAILRKDKGEIKESPLRSKIKKEKNKNSLPVPPIVYKWIKESEKYHFEVQTDSIQAFPLTQIEAYQQIRKQLHPMHAGIRIGEIKGKDILPNHCIAVNHALESSAFPTVSLNWEEAIRYLKKEALLLPTDTEKGYVLVTYNDHPLGFVKNIGNRANNLYPPEWRIRTGFIPDDIRILENS